MNERIKELMARARLDVEALEDIGEMPNALKFAELIVRQCAEICLEANDHKNILRYYGYFGVEE
jgi:hypothetical protein